MELHTCSLRPWQVEAGVPGVKAGLSQVRPHCKNKKRYKVLELVDCIEMAWKLAVPCPLALGGGGHHVLQLGQGSKVQNMGSPGSRLCCMCRVFLGLTVWSS